MSCIYALERQKKKQNVIMMYINNRNTKKNFNNYVKNPNKIRHFQKPFISKLVMSTGVGFYNLQGGGRGGFLSNTFYFRVVHTPSR